MSESKDWFHDLDTNGDGYLNGDEVRNGLKQRNLPCSDRTLASFFTAADADKDGKISVKEFVDFCKEREVELKEIYKEIDANGDGLLTSEEVRHGAQRLGFQIASDQLRSFMKSADQSDTGLVSFHDFHAFLHLLPNVNPSAVFEFLGATHIVDHANSESTPPVEVDASSVAQHVAQAKAAQASGGSTTEDAFWAVLANKLYSGSVAGALSRTATAPIDRLKMILQASAPGKPCPGLVGGAQAIYAEGGVMAFFRGNMANVMKIAPETSVKFVAFDQLKVVLAQDRHNITIGERYRTASYNTHLHILPSSRCTCPEILRIKLVVPVCNITIGGR
jgi:solute carrier family 25 phosphate transporter 23/24/25/41